jgi:hypothetical protein
MRLTLGEVMVSLGESLTQMSATLDRLLVAAYAADRPDRSQVVANLQYDGEEANGAGQQIRRRVRCTCRMPRFSTAGSA